MKTADSTIFKSPLLLRFSIPLDIVNKNGESFMGTELLLIVAFVIILCVFLNKVTGKLGMPMLFAFILLGMLFGEDGIFKIDFNNYNMAKDICSAALVFIIFYGGFGTRWSEAKPVAVKAICLSSLGVIATSIITGLFCHFVLKFPLWEGFLAGSVIGSTDAASVFYILRSRKLNLKYKTASLLELESGSNDPFSYMLTMLFISIMKGNSSAPAVLYMTFAQITFGGVLGVLIAFASIYLLNHLHLSSGFDTAFVAAVALLSYSAAEFIGGNGYLSAYITGIIIGNGKINGKKSLVPFFDGVTGIMQMLIFFLLGLVSSPNRIIPVAVPSLLIALFITFIARPASVFGLLLPFKCTVQQMLVISWSGLRGAASIVFAIIAITSGAAIQNDLFHIVFGIVLFSILFQGSLLPIAAKICKMIDSKGNVLKTFNDYSEESPVQFITLHPSETHPWVGNQIKDIVLPPETLLVLIYREGKKIIPRGTTEILSEDTLILAACSVTAETEALASSSESSSMAGDLYEVFIDENHKFCGKTLSSIKMDSNYLIVLIKRNNKIVIPSGSTKLKEGDIAVVEKE